jgi:acetoin utilization protein AcuB
MRLHDIMTKTVETIAPHATVEEARSRMKQRKIRHLVVQNKGGVVGILSATDIGTRKTKSDAEQTVADYMSEDVITASPTTTVREAANTLRGHAISCLPIVDKKQLVGIITITDLLELIGRGMERS